MDPQSAALVDGAKSALGALAFVALGVSSQGQHDFTEMLTILTLVRPRLRYRLWRFRMMAMVKYDCGLKGVGGRCSGRSKVLRCGNVVFCR